MYLRKEIICSGPGESGQIKCLNCVKVEIAELFKITEVKLFEMLS